MHSRTPAVILSCAVGAAVVQLSPGQVLDSFCAPPRQRVPSPQVAGSGPSRGPGRHDSCPVTVVTHAHSRALLAAGPWHGLRPLPISEGVR